MKDIPTTVHGIKPCSICKKDITRIAETNDEKRVLYESLMQPWTCEDCNKEAGRWSEC